MHTPLGISESEGMNTNKKWIPFFFLIVGFLSPPVHPAWWAHMHRFLSVRL